MEANNMAAMREALSSTVKVLEKILGAFKQGYGGVPMFVVEKVIEEGNSALSAPPRKCDRFVTQPEMSRAYEEYRKSAMKSYGNGLTGRVPTVKQKPMTYDEWLLAPAAERKGEGDA